MKRLHVPISVPNLADSIRFHSTPFAAEPAVVNSDCAIASVSRSRSAALRPVPITSAYR